MENTQNNQKCESCAVFIDVSAAIERCFHFPKKKQKL